MKKWKQLKERIEERQELCQENFAPIPYLLALADIQEIMEEIEHSKKEIGK